jgi:hypothetical protein
MLLVKSRPKHSDYRDAYEVAEQEAQSLIKQKDQIDRRLATLRKTLNALATLMEQENKRFVPASHQQMMDLLSLTMTDDIVNIVSAAPEPMTSSDVLEELRRLGSIAINHDNPLATVNAVLNRLVERIKLEPTTKNGRKAWVKRGYLLKEKKPYQDVPNPLGRNINEMLKESRKKR